MSPINVRSSAEKIENTMLNTMSKLEAAVEHLADRVEGSGKARHMRTNLREKAQEAVAPVMPYIRRTKNAGAKAVEKMRENPRPYVFAGIGIAAGTLALGYLLRKKRSSVMKDSIEEICE